MNFKSMQNLLIWLMARKMQVVGLSKAEVRKKRRKAKLKLGMKPILGVSHVTRKKSMNMFVSLLL
ncbi:hypothetical protein HanXRQr2_Chr11g0498641 [Helianthus annuus]|uniref:Ribosomal protein L35 n=1 Tax=Helianthus annuus TaxID=4232 RepID=A0A9K3N0L7_HELAN|nr:hypothetical protein HanXRQr2_Chr11g0498641 [Helianthus annuus]KAJ0502132.1 hypothetical protein HanHA300_Chr11g0409201 [Helianthus annuus]KAJ0510103.1 hypothetical protein HanIR_Chr11g0536851 [Helianthus annuus]KAJ0518051.1 hypothetical protein HanHA89_Chr11g0432851 [Helianthus annuus]KAJ0686078.1 hypothetical protein HanLR1_Chr11g0410461 [Helianthus annuus]